MLSFLSSALEHCGKLALGAVVLNTILAGILLGGSRMINPESVSSEDILYATYVLLMFTLGGTISWGLSVLIRPRPKIHA